jgi:dienelactone hydrolase
MALPAAAAIQTENVEYTVGDERHVGYLAYDDAATAAARPGVLVVPEWWGLNDYAKQRARQLAKAGYVAFAADMYGEGQTTDDPEQAGAWAAAAKPKLRDLGKAALAELAAAPQSDANALAAIGFCFGGTSVLELGYSDATVEAVVSLHGHLPPPGDDDRIRTSILVLHGAADPMVPLEDVTTWAKALNARETVDWQLVMYGHAEHAFTNPNADSYGMEGVSYEPNAARRAWDQTLGFLHERLIGDNSNAP